MKKLKLPILALASLLGLSMAVAQRPHTTSVTGATYYAMTDNVGGMVWTTTNPGLLFYRCVLKDICVYCTMVFVAGFIPTNGQCPPADKIVSHDPPFHSIYVPIQ